ncbi:hypothetical protein SISNIDRAFT_467472 [Sistotremastrum niveocremeum HHB9708]|uniref:Fungal STAND N-terminal Goodbye domain-containing protein n=1 Tax=Sistotremastrum niveocremeum HHB9708 TaxID=1314777 RepID=A0A164SXI9_9AGAM|nr:hypothetical protein SISNIDRAFT_467472 [Sistotremastrum niveocremeum HHB9708]
MNNLRDRRGNNSKFNGLLLVLQSIKDSADAFPPLKSTAAALLVAIGICKDFRKNREDWFAFAQDLTQFMVDVTECVQKSPHPAVVNRLEEFTNELNDIFGEIVQLLRRSKAERFMQVKADREMLENYQARIREKRDQLHISETVQEALNLAGMDHSSLSLLIELCKGNSEDIRALLKSHASIPEVTVKHDMISFFSNRSITSPHMTYSDFRYLLSAAAWTTNHVLPVITAPVVGEGCILVPVPSRVVILLFLPGCLHAAR